MADSKVVDGLKYTEEHEWVKVVDGLAVVGLTDHAQAQLGDITFVEMPEVDDVVEQMGEMCVVESVKAAADVFAPVGGTVAEVNPALDDEPGLINSDCYGEGWLVKISGFDESELDKLMDAEAYEEFLDSEE